MNFYFKSPVRKQAMEASVPSGSRTRCCYSSGTVCKVAMKLNELLTALKSIIDCSDCN